MNISRHISFERKKLLVTCWPAVPGMKQKVGNVSCYLLAYNYELYNVRSKHVTVNPKG